MLYFVNASIIFVSLFCMFASTMKFHSNKFIKSNIYAEENNLIYLKLVRNTLICSFHCTKIKNCTMIMIKTMEAGNLQQLCHLYHVNNYNNVTFVHEQNLEIWYKDIPKANEEANEANNCPGGFTKLQEGCFHAGSTPSVNFLDACAYCTDLENPNSQLAVFGSVVVSKSNSHQ